MILQRTVLIAIQKVSRIITKEEVVSGGKDQESIDT
jgi:hypothetical protein